MQLIIILLGMIFCLLMPNYVSAQNITNSNESSIINRQKQWILVRGVEHGLCRNLLEEIKQHESQMPSSSHDAISTSDVVSNLSALTQLSWGQTVSASSHYKLMYEIELLNKIGPYCFNNLSLCRNQHPARFAEDMPYVRGKTEGRILAGDQFEFLVISLPERIQSLYKDDPLLSQPLHLVRRRNWYIDSDNSDLNSEETGNSHTEIYLVNEDRSGIDRRFENGGTYFSSAYSVFTHSNAVYENSGVIYAVRTSENMVEVTPWDDSAANNHPYCLIELSENEYDYIAELIVLMNTGGSKSSFDNVMERRYRNTDAEYLEGYPQNVLGFQNIGGQIYRPEEVS